MTKRMWAALLALLLAVAAFPTPATAQADADPLQRTEALLESILTGELARSGAGNVQAWLDGALADRAGQGSEWFLLGLCQWAGPEEWDVSAYRDALTAYLAQGSTLPPVTRQKLALVLQAAGGDPALAAAEATIGQQGIMTWVYGLHLLSNGLESATFAASEVLGQVLSLQLPDGGWALMGQSADVDVTAMALQALAPYQTDPAVAAATQRALSLLAERQGPDGGYSSFREPNPESVAQVLVALSALGIDASTDERFLKNGASLLDSLTAYQLPQGGYAHTVGGPYSQAATMQVFDGLVAYHRLLMGQGGLYLLDRAAVDSGAAVPATPAEQEAAIGIIGGADGPTAIFVTASFDLRAIIVLVIALLAAVACLVLLLRKKRNYKNYLFVLLIAAALIALVLMLDIQTPEAYYGGTVSPVGPVIGTVTLEIRCDALAGQGNDLPEDGCILPPTAFPIGEGDTVYDVLTRAARQYRIQLDASGGQGMKYVVGLHHLYEQAHGELSGWMFFVNGASASQSCDQYALSDGDTILWAYTCQMGADLPN